MEELSRLTDLVERQPGLSSIELRDALRRDGRSSITVADVERTLSTANGAFRTTGDVPPRRWWPADGVVVPAPTAANSAAASGAARPKLYPWQRSALDAWGAAGHRGVVEAVTGSGKTMIGLVATLDEVARRGQVAIVVPTRELLAQWATLLRPLLPSGVVIGLLGDGSKHGLDDHDVVVAVVNSARMAELHPRRPGGLLVADECHRYGSACNRLVLQDGFPRRLGLSATFARSDNAHSTLLDPYLGPVCYRLGYAQARREAVIADFDVVLLTVEFAAGERVAYDDASQQMAVAVGALISRGLIPRDAGDGFLGLLSTLARGDGEAANCARAYLRAMQERRRLMDEAAAKLHVLAELAP
ncbi:MAG: DEAD/DEAH box helicase family protein, partial [Ilumatobacteraceae bacterium]